MADQRQRAASVLDISLRVVVATLFFTGMLATAILAAPEAQAQTFQVLHNFTGGRDGANPLGRLTIDRGGHLYGATYSGGIVFPGGPGGLVFKMSLQGSSWVLTPIFSFNQDSPGDDPAAGVLFGPNGVLYGTASNGGTVFTVRPSPTAPKTVLASWAIDYLYSFTPVTTVPSGDVVFDSAGNIYGVAVRGGSDGCFDHLGCGMVYELTPSAGGWVETTLYEFQGGADGLGPTGVLLDSAGNLIGTTGNGGTQGNGVIFQLTRSGSSWTESVLYNFDCTGNDGCVPQSGLISDASGNLYGSTVASSGYSGVIFEFSPSPGGWVYNVLAPIPPQYRFGPTAPLTMDGAGNLYGTIGTRDSNLIPGAVFKVTRGGSGWTFTSLHDFTGGSDGDAPSSTVAIDANGNLYGTATYGGPHCLPIGCGVVWEITP